MLLRRSLQSRTTTPRNIIPQIGLSTDQFQEYVYIFDQLKYILQQRLNLLFTLC